MGHFPGSGTGESSGQRKEPGSPSLLLTVLAGHRPPQSKNTWAYGAAGGRRWDRGRTAHLLCRTSSGRLFQPPPWVWDTPPPRYWGRAQLEAISPAGSVTSDQGHREVLGPCHTLRRVRRRRCKCAAGSELPQHLFPSRILIILHLSTLQGANGVIM